MNDDFCEEELPFAGFWSRSLFRQLSAVWVIIVTEMGCVSAKHLLRSSYQVRKLYRLSPQLFDLIVALPPESASVLSGGRNLEDGNSIARTGLIVSWDEIQVTWRMGFLHFDIWSRVFVSNYKEHMAFRR